MAGVQSVVDRAAAVNAVALGSAYATDTVKTNFRTTLVVPHQITKSVRDQVEAACDFPVLFGGGPPITHDHAALACMRVLIRQICDQSFGSPLHTEIRTLMVGASHVEVQAYKANPMVHYHFHGSEAKDIDRIHVPIMKSLAKSMRKKTKKSDGRVFRAKGARNDTHVGNLRFVGDKLQSATEKMLGAYSAVNGMPDVFHVACGPFVPSQPFNCLWFRDSIYNMSEEVICDWFENTGAMVGYGYGFFPLELAFDEVLPSRIYKWSRQRENGVATFCGGHCNGYIHNFNNWRTVVTKPILSNGSINICVEIVSRIGPMWAFKMHPTSGKETIVRNIGLRPSEQFYRVMDLKASTYNNGAAKFHLKWWNCPREAVDKTVNYLRSLDEKSLSFQNALAYIRRQAGGVSLVDSSIVKPWDIDRYRYQDLAVACYLHVVYENGRTDRILKRFSGDNPFERLFAALKMVAEFVLLPVTAVMWIINRFRLSDRIILDRDYDKVQISYVTIEGSVKDIQMPMGYENEEDQPSCPFCYSVQGCLGEQELRCHYMADSFHTFEMDNDMIKKMRAECANNDDVAPGLRDTKLAALPHLPTEAFSVKCRVEILRGGPGCGKSEIVRRTGDRHALVVCPFQDLVTEYENIERKGEHFSFRAVTMHKAVAERGYRTIILDEYSAFCYGYLATIVKNNCPDVVYLVGDQSQCGLREPDEGFNIPARIPDCDYSVHEMVYNFRCPKDVVALLNKNYGYNMVAKSDVEKSIFPIHGEPPEEGTRYSFSCDSVRTFIGDGCKSTVRTKQGKTTKTSILYIGSHCEALMAVPSMQIVSISRHKEKLYISTVAGTDYAEKFLNHVGWTPEFVEHMQTYLPAAENGVTIVEADNPEPIEDVLEKYCQDPKDSYLLTKPDQPQLTNVVDERLNREHMALTKASFRNGCVIDPDAFLCPVNAKGHPVDKSREVLKLAHGYGRAYPNCNTGTLQSTGGRNFMAKKPVELGEHHYEVARQIVDKWFRCNVDTRHIDDIGFFEIGNIMTRFEKCAETRDYAKKYHGTEDPDATVVRFFLKNTFKPMYGTLEKTLEEGGSCSDLGKVGQGISAWSATLNTMFCPAFRLFAELIKASESSPNLDNIILTDDGVSDVEFLEQTNAAFMSVKGANLHGVTDWTRYDSYQNEFTQLLEEMYMERYGLNTAFIKHYMSFRKDYRVNAGFMSGNCTFEKASGEPATKLMNGAVAKMISFFLFQGEGKAVIVYKGDDYDQFQCNVKLVPDRVSYVQNFCLLPLKVSLQPMAEFCGMSVHGNVAVPSIIRRMSKFVDKGFRSYDEFAEYQASMRAFVSKIKAINPVRCVSIDAHAHDGMTFNTVWGMWEQFKSWSHIDKKQFLSTYTSMSNGEYIYTGEYIVPIA